ncbi:hypothetical protein RA086_11930 [Lactiplantibacillus sp. WILCCON 0030]|uniref:Uncharacterized protein n=1 Tax=Lactiplantibacillus brownii TaxID=3069269 RepID=A0ABU1ABF5_9LACO|nr:hypothetical protein [Lactiplantibacillus brownii]MDQ7938318.1 hypothetical protein [Lactiplantibacillus brownii]
MKNFWGGTEEWNVETILASFQVYQDFLGFCVTQSLLDKHDYSILLKSGNQVLITSVAEKHAVKITAADLRQAFPGTDGVADLVEIKQLLMDWQIEPQVRDYTPKQTTPMVLKKALTKHQLDLDLNGARKHLTTLDETLDVPIAEADRQCYHEVILQLHHDMVTTYHRRMKQWTLATLTASLQKMFRETRQLDGKPTFFRYLQLYIDSQGQAHRLISWESCAAAVQISVIPYLIASTNALSAKS